MKKFLTIALMSAITLSALNSCAANSPGAGNSKVFGLLSNDQDNSENFGRMQNNFMGFLKDLNLSQDQKEQLKTLKESMKSQFQNNTGKREDLKNTLKEAFLSSSIDKSLLKAKLLALRPENEDRIALMANNIIKAYNILTPGQRVKVENKMKEMENKMGGFINNPLMSAFHGGPEKRIEKLAERLNLTDSQKESLKTLLKDGMPDRKGKFEKAVKIKTAILSELKSPNPDADNIKGILKEAKVGMEENFDKRIDKLVMVHDLLIPEQRQKLVEILEKVHDNVQKKFKSRFNHRESNNIF